MLFKSASSGALEILSHSSHGHHLGDLVLRHAVFATLASKSTQLDTAKPIAELVTAFIADLPGKITYGEAASLISPVFTPTIPVSNASATRYTLCKSLL